MAKFADKTVIAAKVEVTPGTDITPGAADCIVIRDGHSTVLEMSYAERNIVRGFFGNSDALPTLTKRRVTFEVELAGSGAAGTAPAWDGLMQACANSSTNVPATSQTWAPQSPGVKTLSLYYNMDGVLHKLLYGRGSASLKYKANDIPVIGFDFMGLDIAATDTALLTPSSFGAYIRPVTVSKLNTPTFNLLGTAAALESLDFNLGNTNELVSRVNSESILHTGRKVTGSVTIEMTSIAVKDWLAAVKAATLGALQLIHGTVAGNIITLNAANTQLMNPKYSKQQGINMISFDIKANPSNAGNDEYSLVNT
jgi:hypothetical protein